MNRKPKAIVAAVAMALAGTLLLGSYVHAAEAKSSSGEGLVPVLVATKKIAAGTPAGKVAAMVTTQEVPANVRTAGAIVKLDEIKGTVAGAEVLPGEQLSHARFVAASELHHATVPAGLLEVTVALDPVRALGGTLSPDQHVAVLESRDDDGSGKPVTGLILQHVLVTRVQATEAMPSQDDSAAVQLAPKATMLITLAVSAADVQKVVFAAEHGRIWLSLEGAAA